MSLHTSDSLPVLAGRHALVTGANRGIGAAIARTLSAAGAKVSLLVRDATRAEAVAAALNGPYAVVVADVTDHEALLGACAAAAGALGPIDILVNNAGTAESAPFLKSDTALFDRMIAMHLMAPRVGLTGGAPLHARTRSRTHRERGQCGGPHGCAVRHFVHIGQARNDRAYAGARP